ncbi:MAG: insulinase family protein [Treponema sp.]|jgi:zinc protease|nr:insulinase family protein [Treponema sp.]
MIFINRRFFGQLSAFWKGALCAALYLGAGVFAAADPKLPLFVLPTETLYGGLGQPGDPLPPKAALRTGTLPSGLRYYILENSLPADRAYLTLAVNAGSVLEAEDEQGLAHFVEHMAFNGTRRFPGTELVNYLRSLGMRFGPEVNAYTSYDETVYGVETPVEQGEDGLKRIPERALAILDDWTYTVTFNDGDVDKERAIILEEYRTRLGAQDRVRRKILPVIFRGSRYADRLPIGLPEVIQNAPPEKLRNFYQTWYRPDNMAIFLVGDFDGAALEKDLTAHFTAPAPSSPLERPRYGLPGPQKGSVITTVVTDPELPGSTVYLYYKQSPKIRSKTLQAYRERLIDTLISFMTDFRYEEEASREDCPYIAAGAWSWQTGYNQEFRYYIMAAQAKAEKSADTLKALLLEKERLVRYGFTQAELDRAKTSLASILEMTEAEKDRRESEDYLTELTADYLKGEFSPDPEWEREAAARLFPGITLKTVNQTLLSYYADDDLAALITAPEAEAAALPAEEEIRSLAGAIRVAAVSPREEKVENPGLVDEEPPPGSVASVSRDDSGAEIWELSNGMRVILMETANKNNELELYALARGGTIPGEDLPPEEAQLFSAQLAAEIQGASGLGRLNRSELLDFLSSKQVSLSFWTSPFVRGFRGSSTVKDLATLFQMFHVYFTQPRVDSNALHLVQDQYRTRLLQEADNPESVFFRELPRILYGGSPLFRPIEIADLDGVTLDGVLSFLFLSLNPADYTLILTGSLGDRETLRALVETWAASIPGTGKPRRNEWAKPEIRRPGKTGRIIHKGREAKSVVYMGWFVPKPWTGEDNAAALALNEYLDIVLNDEIRETLGGVYSISASAALTPMPAGELSLSVYFVCDPKREAELREAVRNRIAALAAGEIDGTIFSRAREALVKSFERSMENNAFIARNLGNFSVVTGAPLSHLARRPALYRSVTPEQAAALAAELAAAGPVEVILLPETADNGEGAL